ncbi:hypothetical protein BDW02DRAFT_489592 [Decorospora gaudefroyi]|uniref:Uncharacterized protein n=1 Tax=Decorospora gaudefroyi TaxID=184978 RepID=A0A6A5KWY7_9PLEO|nr:hypothetical protein BDW02DRAFT_489592 [Decorospora gaudefroyi]
MEDGFRKEQLHRQELAKAVRLAQEEVKADYYEEGTRLTQENEALKQKVAECEKQLQDSAKAYTEAESNLRTTNQQLDIERKGAEGLHTYIATLEGNLTRQQASMGEAQERFNTMYAELQQAHATCKTVLKERDEACAHIKSQELQFADLTADWQQKEGRIGELEGQVYSLQDAVRDNAHLQDEITAMRKAHDSETQVKDERINHLEAQYQKERLRVVTGDDEQARAAAAVSPLADGPKHVAPINDSLEEELAGQGFEEEYADEYEPNDFSAITETPLTTAPIAPALPALSTLWVYEAASTSPILPALAAPSTISVREAASTTPIAPALPAPSTIGVQEAASTSPIAPAPAAPFTISVQEAASTSSLAPALAAPSTISIHEAASTSPSAPALAAPSTISIQKAASTSPIAPAPAAPSTISIHKAASTSPVAPTPTLSSLSTIHELVSVSPTQARIPALTLSVEEAASISPIARQITTTEHGTQTDAFELTVEPVRAPAQQLRTQIFDIAVIDISPIEPEAVEPVSTAEANVQTESAPTIDTDIQTDFDVLENITQTAPANPNNHIVPIIVTHEVHPVDQVIQNSLMINAEAQTTSQVTPKAPKTASPIITTTSKSTLSYGWIYALIIASLLLTCVSQWLELAVWKTANGIGYNGMATRGGAYGNGRHLLGFPIAMNIGGSWWTEQIARQLSIAIMRFEDWAALTYAPHY